MQKASLIRKNHNNNENDILCSFREKTFDSWTFHCETYYSDIKAYSKKNGPYAAKGPSGLVTVGLTAFKGLATISVPFCGNVGNFFFAIFSSSIAKTFLDDRFCYHFLKTEE